MRSVSISVARTTRVLVRSSAAMTACFSAVSCCWGRPAVGLNRLVSMTVSLAASAYWSGMTEICWPDPGRSICLMILISR